MVAAGSRPCQRRHAICGCALSGLPATHVDGGYACLKLLGGRLQFPSSSLLLFLDPGRLPRLLPLEFRYVKVVEVDQGWKLLAHAGPIGGKHPVDDVGCGGCVIYGESPWKSTCSSAHHTSSSLRQVLVTPVPELIPLTVGPVHQVAGRYLELIHVEDLQLHLHEQPLSVLPGHITVRHSSSTSAPSTPRPRSPPGGRRAPSSPPGSAPHLRPR